MRLTVTPQGGFQGAVLLSLEGALQGVGLSPQAVNVAGTAPVQADLTLSAQASTPPGSYNLTLKATSGSLVRTHPLALTIQGGGNISGTVSLGPGIQGQTPPPLEAGVGSMPSRAPGSAGGAHREAQRRPGSPGPSLGPTGG